MRKLLVVLLLLAGCVANAPFRTQNGVKCEHWKGCGAFYEDQGKYDLGFVEFSERGNDFNPDQTTALLNKVTQASNAGEVALVIFVHGWQHNASTEDSNVESFKEALEHLAISKVAGNKKLIGIYIGWRGKSFFGLGLENLTFWDRKATAEEVGRGGVTEFLVRLESISAARKGNFMLTVGHSFGSAIVLSALNDTLMEKMLDQQRGETAKPFGDAVVLLNPAVEADLGLLLKENSMKVGHLRKPVPTLMYVISSRADVPTNVAFPIGQFLGVDLLWDQTVLQRNYYGHLYQIAETSLDHTTIGNYDAFRTGYMSDEIADASSTAKYAAILRAPPATASTAPGTRTAPSDKLGKWGFESYCSDDLAKATEDRFPCFENDPLDVISVPQSFIKNHNDVFNDSVKSLLTAAVAKSLSEKNDNVPSKECAEAGKFSLGICFAYYYEVNKRITELEAQEGKGR
jgi:hypothetical protein